MKGDAMGTLSSFRNLLYALSRIPGLGFLRSSASAAGKVDRVARNVESAKKAAGELRGKEKKADGPEGETAKPEQAEDPK